MIRTWHWLLRQTRLHPWRSGITVVAVLMGVSLALGWWLKDMEQTVIKWLDIAFVVLGGLSMTAGWAVALVVRAQRKEASLAFPGAGQAVDRADFDAWLFLVHEDPTPIEWQLRHHPCRRLELAWTAKTRDAARRILRLFPEMKCLHGPERDADCLDHPFDVKETKEYFGRLLAEMLQRHPAHRIAVNVTGGTAVMSIAAFQAAEEAGVSSFYVMGAGGRPKILAAQVGDPKAGQLVLLSDRGVDRSTQSQSEPESCAPSSPP
jgi:hypothetical protein